MDTKQESYDLVPPVGYFDTWKPCDDDLEGWPKLPYSITGDGNAEENENNNIGLDLTSDLLNANQYPYELYPELVDYEELFRTTPDPIIIPCGILPRMTEDRAREEIRTIFQDGSADLTFVASCECGDLTGNFYEGQKCPRCNTVCKTNFATDLRFRAWLRIDELGGDPKDPLYIPPILHPAMYSILNQWIGSANKVSVLDSLLNPELPLPKQLIDDGIGQGYQYFYNNYDDIINYFLTRYKPLQAKAKRAKADAIKALVEKYRHLTFYRHIPILNQSLHLITTSGTLKLTDNSVDFILKAKGDLSDLLYQHRNLKVNSLFINTRLWTVYKSILGYVNYIAKVSLFGKTGHIRKNIAGSRIQCSARAVITPISGKHDFDELYIPWKIGVELLKLEIINVLVNRMGYTVDDALTKQNKASVSYDAEVDEIMKTLIRECREKSTIYIPHLGRSIHPKGLPALFGRNPTLRLGAIMLYFITRIKTDLDDDTISVSSRCAKAPNFDFDGDAMHLLVIKEMDMLATLMRMHPSMVILAGPELGWTDTSEKKPFIVLTGDIAITKQEAINLTAWLEEEDTETATP